MRHVGTILRCGCGIQKFLISNINKAFKVKVVLGGGVDETPISFKLLAAFNLAVSVGSHTHPGV